MMTRNGERTERKMVLRNQMRYERTDNPTVRAVVASGNSEVIGGEGRPLEGAAVPIAAEDELCPMVGESRLVRRALAGVASVTVIYDLWQAWAGTPIRYHMTMTLWHLHAILQPPTWFDASNLFVPSNCVKRYTAETSEALATVRWGRYTLLVLGV